MGGGGRGAGAGPWTYNPLGSYVPVISACGSDSGESKKKEEEKFVQLRQFPNLSVYYHPPPYTLHPNVIPVCYIPG